MEHHQSTADRSQLILFVLLLAVAAGAGRRAAEGGPDRGAVDVAAMGTARPSGAAGDALRKRVGTTGVVATVVVVALLPFVIGVGPLLPLSQICIYGVIALSLTVLTGWAGQVSLGQFGFVAVGAVIAAHLGEQRPPDRCSCPSPARSPRSSPCWSGCRRCASAASTWPSAPWASPCSCRRRCWPRRAGRVPLIGNRHLHRAAQPGVHPDRPARPSSGSASSSERAFAWFSLGVLVLSVLMVRVLARPGRRPPAGRRCATTRSRPAAMGIPVVRTKLLAFALSGFMAGYAGVCLAFATERFSTATFDPDLLHPGRLHGGDRRARLDPRRRARAPSTWWACPPSSAPPRPSSS